MCATMTEREFLFYNEKLGARIYVREGREVVVDRDYYRDPDAVSLYLLGNVFGAVLYMRGMIPFRASAVQGAQGAVLFFGAAGVGKSTLAGALVRRGYSLVADGMASVELENESVYVRPGGSMLRLWRDSLQYNQWPARASARVRKGLNKYYVRAPDEMEDGLFPIHKMYHLTVHNAGDLLITERAGNGERGHLLRSNLYHWPYARGLNREAQAELAVAGLAGLPMSTIARPQRPHHFEETVCRVESDLGS